MDYYGVPLEYFSGTFGVLLEYFWSATGVPLECYWSTFGIPLEYLWSFNASTFGQGGALECNRVEFKSQVTLELL